MTLKFTFYPYNKQLFSVLFALVIFLVSYAQNPIVTENALPGNPSSEWDITGAGDLSIQGFATDISVNKGGTVRFKINVTGAVSYSIKIYRLGYYQGNGARLVANLGSFAGTVQPAPLTNISTGLVDCGNWSESANWAIPTTAVSGIYVAKLTRSGTNGSSHIIFIVRDDAGNSPLLFKASDATWQAYNVYGGNSSYVGTTSFPGGHAAKVSYNRPFLTRSGGGGGGPSDNWLFNGEYPMLRFLERNGYNVSYTTDVDMERDVSAITPSIHKVLLSVGHDEYWSAAERTKFENARNAGVHLAFFSGNEVYWKTRWEDNNRTLVCYKDGTLGENVCNTKCDPTSTWTGLWRDGAAYDAGRPENALSGQISWVGSIGSIEVPASYKKIRFWRNTSIATATTTTILPNGTLGYEWNWEQYPDSYPSGRITMSSTTVSGKTHKLSLYRHSGGALVFGAGTIQWAWGLDNYHDIGGGGTSVAMQQATVNLFADMGVQPGTLQSGLFAASASTDVTPPLSTILSPSGGSTAPAGSAVTITGAATDAAGGVVAGVEISVDGGLTWKQADINAAGASSTWSYTWFPRIEGTFTIRSRAFDDSGNKENSGAGINITISPAVCPCTIFQPSDVAATPLGNDGQGGCEFGMKFRSTQNGFITGIRFYKGAGTTGTHIGSLWSNTGSSLATATFTSETASGWQQVSFSSPVAITAGITYVASYYSSSGDYALTNPFFTQAVVSSSLRALANGEDGPNGLFKYSATPTFPANGFQSSNYWVDVVFATGGGGGGGSSPVVTTQPTAQTICDGNNARFYSAASGQPAPTVQWQSSIYGIIWTNINGATNNTLNIATTIWDNNKQYRAVWKNSEGVVNSYSVTLRVNAIPGTPTITVVNNCGNSVLTARSFAGSLLWSNGATTSSITVTTAGTYTAKQTIKGCISLPGIGTASPKVIPVLSSSLKAILNSGASFIYIPTSTVAGTVFTWSRAAVKGISNPAATGSGNIMGALINTTNSPVNVTYVYTLWANSCSKTQNVVITVNPSQAATACLVTTSIVSGFNSTPIPSGRYIWFNSSFTPGSFGKLKKKEPVTFYVTNSWINFIANGRQYILPVPNSRIRFDENVVSASTKFINNVWETVVPLSFDEDVFMGGLSFLVPSGLPGNISNVKWTADVRMDKTGISLTWNWGASVYTRFAGNAGLYVKPVSGKKQNPYPNYDEAGSPENFKEFVVTGATGQVKDKNEYKLSYSKKNKIDCTKDDDDDDDDHDKEKHRSAGESIRKLSGQLPSLPGKEFSNEILDVKVMPNPSSSYFDLVIGSKSENPVSVRILNIFGRVLEKHEKITSKTVLRLGQQWTNGVYFAVVIQGDQQKIVKIIKAK